MPSKPAKKKKFVIGKDAPKTRPTSAPIYATKLGSMYVAKSDELLALPSMKKHKGKVQLVFTSPPFPLIAKKKYGNKQGDEYVEFLASFAPLLKGMLKPNGSIVIEIGNAWEPGEPVMSTVVLRALLKFLEKGGLHLCQEFIWYNPARLPSPVQWVNVERIRVKDAFTRLWWMSPVTRPKADNRKVLREYSDSMKLLLKNQSYNAGRRPSHHVIGKKSFNTSNGGAIPTVSTRGASSTCAGSIRWKPSSAPPSAAPPCTMRSTSS